MSRISSVYQLNEEPRVQRSRLEANHLTARSERQRQARGAIRMPKATKFVEYRGEQRHFRDGV